VKKGKGDIYAKLLPLSAFVMVEDPVDSVLILLSATNNPTLHVTTNRSFVGLILKIHTIKKYGVIGGYIFATYVVYGVNHHALANAS
jgi:hypothetical protein